MFAILEVVLSILGVIAVGYLSALVIVSPMARIGLLGWVRYLAIAVLIACLIAVRLVPGDALSQLKVLAAALSLAFSLCQRQEVELNLCWQRLQSEWNEATAIRDFGLAHFAALSESRHAAITEESLKQCLASMPANGAGAPVLKAMLAKIEDIGEPVDSVVTEDTEVYSGAPHSPLAFEIPVVRRCLIYGISKADLEHYPERIEKKTASLLG